MSHTVKAGFFDRTPSHLLTHLIKSLFLMLMCTFLSFGMDSAWADKTASNTTSHKKTTHHHTQKKHSHRKSNKKHLKKKKQAARHAQLRHPEPDNQDTLAPPADVSLTEPVSHDLASVNLTRFTSRFPANLMHSVKQGVVDFVEKTVDTLHYSSYKLGGKHFDPERGVYIVDCSNFVDNILQNVYPDAYSSLVNSVGADNPASEHYFNFFHDLGSASDSHWNKINHVEQLQPGDILVFRYKNSRGAETGGHVMVVMQKPEQASDVFFVRVADSAPSRHSEDTRHFHESGIGIGTLLLKANPLTGKPSAFAWGVNSYWNRNVKFAMARPVGMNAEA